MITDPEQLAHYLEPTARGGNQKRIVISIPAGVGKFEMQI
jgi:hypothetical protein